MELKDISYIIAIYEHKNISKAAQSLYISQSALSQQLHKIEFRLGKQLFIRAGHTVTPTAAGRIIIEHGRKLLAERNLLLYAVEHLQEVPEEEISIGFSAFYSRHLLPGIMERFQKENPQYVLHYSDNASSYELEKKVINGDLDCCVVPMFPRDPEIEYLPIGTEEILLAVPRDHPLNQLSLPDRSIDLALTKDEPFILHREHDKIFVLQERIFSDAGFQPNCRYTATGWDSVMSFANNGLGLTLVTELIVNDYRPENTPCYYHIRYKDATRLFALGYRRGRIPTPAAQKLLEVVTEEFSLQKQQVKI